jgi:hypothetical protein
MGLPNLRVRLLNIYTCTNPARLDIFADGSLNGVIERLQESRVQQTDTRGNEDGVYNYSFDET